MLPVVTGNPVTTRPLTWACLVLNWFLCLFFWDQEVGLGSGTAMWINRAQCQGTSSLTGHRAFSQGTWEGDILSADGWHLLPQPKSIWEVLSFKALLVHNEK